MELPDSEYVAEILSAWKILSFLTPKKCPETGQKVYVCAQVRCYYNNYAFTQKPFEPKSEEKKSEIKICITL